jgi:DNA anti-recombination protein RmuC
MGKINESLFALKEQLKQEKDERNLRLSELRKYADAELSSQRKFNEGTLPQYIEFHNKCFRDFKESIDELRKEMNERFSSKDEIINSISKVVKTLQNTLRHPN